MLEDAANYIQELQGRVKELEGLSELKRKNMQGSDISAKRSRLSCSDDDGSSSNETNFEESSSPCNPEIEVRESGFSLLVEIYSRKNCTTLVKVLREIQKLGLSVISSSTMPFGDTTLLITIVAQVYFYVSEIHNHEIEMEIKSYSLSCIDIQMYNAHIIWIQ